MLSQDRQQYVPRVIKTDQPIFKQRGQAWAKMPD